MTQVSSAAPHRIALFTGTLGIGGTTTFLCNFGGELARRGIPVKVFNFEEYNPLAEDFDRLKIPVFVTRTRQIFEDRLVQILRETSAFRPTVAVASLSAAAFEVLRYMPRGVFRVGAVQSDDPGPYGLIDSYHQQLDGIAAVSLTIQKRLRAVPKFAPTPVHYLPYGVPMPETTGRPERAADQPLRILYLGRLDREQKRVHLFPEILEHLKSSGIPFEWTLAGTGSEEQSLRRSLVTSAPRQQVSVMGPVLYREIPGLLARHDIFLLASDYEGLPLSLLEAMGAGLAPVVSDLESGTSEVVDPACGILVKPSDTRGYAEAVIRLHADRTKLAELSANAQSKVRGAFSVASMTDRWLSILPPPATNPSQWPATWRPLPILTDGAKWRYSPPFRPLRRLLKKLPA